MCLELNLSPKITMPTVKKFSKEMEQAIDVNLAQYLKSSYTNYDYYIMLKKCFFGKVTCIEDITCVVCGNPVRADRRNMKTCHSEKCLSITYATQKDKKRPEHAKKMSKIINEKIANGEWWNEEHRKNNRRHINSIKMKTTELINRGIIEIDDEYSDEEIKKLISIARRDDKLSNEFREKSINSFLKNEVYTGSEFFNQEYF